MKTLCLDFDGVLNSYLSGWQGPGIISDPPTQGAMEFLIEAIQHFKVAIFSSRSAHLGGVHAMQYWLLDHLEPHVGQADALRIVNEVIDWPTDKPPAFVSIDDRCMLFTGVWPDMEELQAFTPWNAKS